MGLADQILGGVTQEGAEPGIDCHHVALEIELDDAIGAIERTQSRQDVIATEGVWVHVAVEGTDRWGIHDYDSFR